MNRLVYFEQIAGSARKFYLMTEDDGGSTFTANYGRIGTTGSVKTYPMSKWQHVYNTRIQHGYTDKTRDYLAGRTSLSPKTKPVDGIKYNITGMCKTVKRHRVYRIVATKNFETVDGRIVEKGEPGGWQDRQVHFGQRGCAPCRVQSAVHRQADDDRRTALAGIGRAQNCAVLLHTGLG